MDGLEAILTRRSCRVYDGRPVPDELIENILRAGMFAPSAMNRKPWEFIVVKDAAIKREASELGPYWGMLDEAAFGILTVANLEFCKGSQMYVQDCSAATENMLLAANALGLGGVWLGLYPNEDRIEGIRELFGLPDNIVPISMISVGYPAEDKKPHSSFRADRVHYDKY
jgi:nitroreductase